MSTEPVEAELPAYPDAIQPADEELWQADPNCQHETYCAPGGGIKCRHCPGWFCY